MSDKHDPRVAAASRKAVVEYQAGYLAATFNMPHSEALALVRRFGANRGVLLEHLEQGKKERARVPER
jgi:hypothetical protein